MDGYQFVASLVQSLVALAWPIALVICVWLFRERLNFLLPRLRFKYKDVEASFRLEQAEKDAAELPPLPPNGEQAKPTPEEKSRFEKLAELSPSAAILEWRRELEELVRFYAAHTGLDLNVDRVSLLTLIRALRSGDFVGPKLSAVLDDLRVIGNQAAHGSPNEFTKEDAMRFRALVERASEALRTAIPVGPNPNFRAEVSSES